MNHAANQIANQAANQTKITVTSVAGNPVLTFEGQPSKKMIAKVISREFGFQMNGGIPVPHSFCGVTDPAPQEERPSDLNLFGNDHATSRRWASQ